MEMAVERKPLVARLRQNFSPEVRSPEVRPPPKSGLEFVIDHGTYVMDSNIFAWFLKITEKNQLLNLVKIPIFIYQKATVFYSNLENVKMASICCLQ